MIDIAGDSRYDVSYRSTWGSPGDAEEPIGHLVIRRLDDHAVVAEVPARTEDEARTLIERAEQEVRGPAAVFEAAWGLEVVEAVPLPPMLPPSASADPEQRDADDGEEVFPPDTRVHVLPDPAAVFAADQPWLARVLHPLLSVELSAIDPSWAGLVPVLSPVEPTDGLLGETTDHHHDEHARENWITFRLDADSRARFLGDQRYFELEAHELAATAVPDELRDWYAEAELEFTATRARWQANQVLAYGDRLDASKVREGRAPLPVLDQLGGEPGYGNWASYPPPSALRLDESNPITPVLTLADGRPFAFVCATSGYPWRENGADAILVFYEPETRTAAMTFDWS